MVPITYPWPYSDRYFAPWPEEDDTLITDPANFVIRHSTSYCAFKIYEATGKWPTKRQKARYDAKDWDEFLTLNGYPRVFRPYDHEHKRFVGIAPNEGEFGQLYWFEHEEAGGDCICTTYRNSEPEAIYLYGLYREVLIWHEIC